MTTERTELLVIGGGPGGYVAALRGAINDLNVTLVDADALGGTCLNYGCIPSKALISAVDRVHRVSEATQMGIYTDPYIDTAELRDWKDSIVDRLVNGISELCEVRGVSVINGRAQFVDCQTATVRTAEQTIEIGFEHAIVATGSRPLRIDGFDSADPPILDSKKALDLESIPARLIVIGAGYIGMELSTLFRKLGSEVLVVEMLDEILPRYDSDIAGVVKHRATSLGIDFRLGEQAQGWEYADGSIRVTATDRKGAVHRYDAEKALVAVGREPVTDTANLETIGLSISDDGFIETDARGRTTVPNVYAIGDVAGEPMLAHEATKAGTIAADSVAGRDVNIDEFVVPKVVYTDPEIATVGLDETAAAAAGHEPIVGEFPLSANGRSLTLGEDEGFVRLVADKDTQRLLGAAIVGPEASELVAEPTLAIYEGLSVDAIAGSIHAHPTISEALAEAGEAVFSTPTHSR